MIEIKNYRDKIFALLMLIFVIFISIYCNIYTFKNCIKAGMVTNTESNIIKNNVCKQVFDMATSLKKDDKNLQPQVVIESHDMYTNACVNVRASPNTESEILCVLSPNTRVTVLEYNDGWYKIRKNIDHDELNIAYIKAEYISPNRTPISELNRWGIELAQDEVDLLAKILWVEARGEPFEGQAAVVEVVFNRMISNDIDFEENDLYGILSSTKHGVQFDSWEIRDTANPGDGIYQVIYQVLDGSASVLPSNDYIYFSTKGIGNNLIKIGSHYFGT